MGTIKDENFFKRCQNAVITIDDNAGGIQKNILPRIFEPYFTTKHESQGTSLGLHMSYKIINESIEGNLFVKNTQNGALFTIEITIKLDATIV